MAILFECIVKYSGFSDSHIMRPMLLISLQLQPNVDLVYVNVILRALLKFNFNHSVKHIICCCLYYQIAYYVAIHTLHK